MVYHIILAVILLIACIFPRPCGAWKNTTQLAKYPRVLYVKPSNKMYILNCIYNVNNNSIQYLLIISNSTSKFVNFVISSLWWVITCPPSASWHVRLFSIKPCLHTQLSEHNRSHWKVSRGWGHLITWNGPMMGHLNRWWGIWTAFRPQ